MNRNQRSSALAVIALVSAPVFVGGGVAVAQDDSFTHPAYSERGSNETLMDRTDLGNVAQSSRMMLADGVREIKRAAKLEKKLAGADEAKRAEIEEKIQGAYENAVQKLTESIRLNPKQIDAYTSLGEAYGRLGKHQHRLQVHAAALKVDPGHQENFRGWAGAILELNMLGDATQAWGHFETRDPALAGILLTEVYAWLERRREEPGDLASEDIEKMATWLEERS